MQGLFKKVTAGTYPEIPKFYSAEFAGEIKQMLQQNPANRPSCEEILAHPCVRERIPEAQIVQESDQVLAEGKILGTIMIPKNLNVLAARLPKPNYFTPQMMKKYLQ